MNMKENNARLVFDIEKDGCFIPYSPVTVRDDVEFRFQIRNVGKRTTVYVVIKADGKIVCEKEENVAKGGFLFGKYTQKYACGEHEITVLYKAEGDAEFSQASTSIVVNDDKPIGLNGGFVMLGPPEKRKPMDYVRADIKSMTDEDWRRYVDALHAADIDCIIVTATVQLREIGGDNVAHYPSAYYPHSEIAAADPIKAILETAQKNGQRVFIGLGHTYKSNRIKNTADVMRELYSLYGDYASFYGWYESEEFNIRKNSRKIWRQVAKIRKIADELSPVKPLLVSPWSEGVPEYNEYGKIHPTFIKRLIKGDGKFDIIAVQDMVGHSTEGGKLNTKESRAMYKSLSAACEQAKKHVWANCEFFDFDDDGIMTTRYRNGGMFGDDGFIGQMQAVEPYSEKTVAFMLNGFFTPQDFVPQIGGNAAVKQFVDYQNGVNAVRERK